MRYLFGNIFTKYSEEIYVYLKIKYDWYHRNVLSKY